MDTMASAKFRKSYAGLREATIVQVNGHSIGIWVPAEAGLIVDIEHGGDGRDVPLGEHVGFGDEHPVVPRDRLGNASLTQAERDAILRRINKAK